MEAASETAWYAPPYNGEGTTARDHHRAVPVLATTLPLLRRLGAGAAIWHRFGRDGWHTLNQALDNPDGDQLLYAERVATEQRARQAAERERAEAETAAAEANRAAPGSAVPDPASPRRS